MARCTATASRTGERCRNPALDGEVTCQVHYRLHEEDAQPAEPAPAAAFGPGESSPAPATDPVLEGLEPEEPEEPAPRGGVTIDPALFAGLEEEEESSRDRPGPGPMPQASPDPLPRGVLLAQNPGPWHPRILEGVLLPPLNRTFHRHRVPPLDGPEADTWLEALSASLNRIASRIDPNNPYAALALSTTVMLGTRYMPLLLRGRSNGKERTSEPSQRGGPRPAEAPKEPELQEEEAPGTWADSFGLR